MKKERAKKIIQKNKEDWDDIAKKFSNTRQYLWPELKSLNNYVKTGDRVLDLGCGNARLIKAFKKEIYYTGVDISKNLINIAKKKYQDKDNIKLINANVINLPFKENSFDIVFSIAMFHHIPGLQLRKNFLKEIARVLKKDSNLIITVWNLWRPSILLRYKIWPMLFGWHPKGLDWKDVYIPFKSKDKITKRYYHCFTKSELVKLLKKTGFKVINCRKTKKGNILLICKNII